MEKEYDIVAMGELLIDFTPAGVSETGMCLYERNPGGAPVNMLTAAAKAGLRTAFIGKVGNDMHGKFLIEAVENQNINQLADRILALASSPLDLVEFSQNSLLNAENCQPEKILHLWAKQVFKG